MEVTTAFIVVNIPSTKLVLQKHLPILKQRMNHSMAGFNPATVGSEDRTKVFSSVSTQGNEPAHSPGEKPDYESGRLQVLHLDEQGRPKLSNLNTYHI